MQDPANELLRILLPRTPVNRTKRKSRGPSLGLGPAAFSASDRYGVASCTMKLP
jgi:hypothetical protein